MDLALSVLDQSPVSEGMSQGDALTNSVDLARWTESLGYSRYWLAEHHGTPMLAGTSPEILIAAVGAATSRIRVGSGGVMLPHYSAVKVAECFGVLSGLYPDRIDLAVGRAAGTDPLTAFALQRDRRHPAADDFPEQLSELLAYVRDGLPETHRFARLARLAGDPHGPTPWLLGSSPQSAIWAAELGLPYAFADFINPNGAEYAREYRARFVPSKTLREPQVLVAVWALAAETAAEAERLASSARAAFLHFLQGTPIPVPPVDAALSFFARNPDALSLHRQRRRSIVGAAPDVFAGITGVAEEYGAAEAMIVTITHEHAARRRSYELLAQEARLERRT